MYSLRMQAKYPNNIKVPIQHFRLPSWEPTQTSSNWNVDFVTLFQVKTLLEFQRFRIFRMLKFSWVEKCIPSVENILFTNKNLWPCWIINRMVFYLGKLPASQGGSHSMIRLLEGSYYRRGVVILSYFSALYCDVEKPENVECVYWSIKI